MGARGPYSDKPWAEALQRAVRRESTGKGSRKWLEIIADRCVADAAAGEIRAIREIGDRMDGKAKQQIEATTSHNYVAILPEVISDTEEWLKQHAPKPTH